MAAAAEAAAGDDAESQPAKKGGKKKLIVLVALVLLLAGAGAGLWFGGILPPLLGMGKKADDVFTIPLCSHHHAERHRIGWRTFDRAHNLDALDIAKDIARRSPAVQRAAMAAGYNAGGDIEPNP